MEARRVDHRRSGPDRHLRGCARGDDERRQVSGSCSGGAAVSCRRLSCGLWIKVLGSRCPLVAGVVNGGGKEEAVMQLMRVMREAGQAQRWSRSESLLAAQRYRLQRTQSKRNSEAALRLRSQTRLDGTRPQGGACEAQRAPSARGTGRPQRLATSLAQPRAHIVRHLSPSLSCPPTSFPRRQGKRRQPRNNISQPSSPIDRVRLSPRERRCLLSLLHRSLAAAQPCRRQWRWMHLPPLHPALIHLSGAPR